uniref:Coiled-coil domain containing 103 n=1 Tax=Sinocyclocheilus anshuiensis TaxID=1608454 RepID=A0A671P4D4_9TELE
MEKSDTIMKYQKENYAKFRALNKNVASYEEFRDIVLASHLQPLDRKDISGAPRKQPWNPVPFSTKHKSASSEKLSEIQPRSCLKSGDEEIVIGVLDGLSRTGRFGLNLSLLSQAEQKACEELFHKLQVAVGDSSDTSMVCEASLTRVEDDETDITAQLKALMGKYGIQK